MTSIEDGQVTMLLCSVVVAMLISVTRHMPEHARKTRAVTKVEEAVRDLAKLHGAPLDVAIAPIGGRLLNHLLEDLEEALLELDADHEQLELPL